jgi:3-methylfumaryl-CoA hydratase
VADAGERWQPWIGRTESVEDDISAAPVRAVLATLDDSETRLAAGDPLPPLWQWFYFLPRAPQSRLSPDGHPERGGFLPPIALPRRMFAGARMRFHRPLVIGRPAERHGTIRHVSEKDGRSGRLAFVTVGYDFSRTARSASKRSRTSSIAKRARRSPLRTPKPLPRCRQGHGRP